MGQLEKYGLYVLCLVIFLILGVTVWGGGDVPPPARGRSATAGDLSANPRGPGGTGSPNVAGNTAARDTGTALPDLASLLRPVEPPKKPEPRPADQAAQPQNPPVKAADPAVVPPKSPAASPTPAAETARPTYKVAVGDTFDSIAKAKLGSASLRTEIARLNPRVEPSRLQIDQVLVLPTPAEVAALTGKSTRKAVDATAPTTKDAGAVAPTAEGRTYTIAKGDTFESIARRELGSARRVDEIRAANPDVDPTRLKIGRRIVLPKK